MTILQKIINLTKQLYPTGRVWKMKINSIFEKLHAGLAESEKDVYTNIVGLLNSVLPDNDNFSADDAARWESALVLLTDTDIDLTTRKEIISRKINFPGTINPRQHYLYLEKMLQDVGLDLYVHENRFDDGAGGYKVENPTGCICGVVNVAQSNVGNIGIDNISKIANHIEKAKDDSFVLGNDANLRATFFIGGATFPNRAEISPLRLSEYRDLVLKVKPAHTVALSLVDGSFVFSCVDNGTDTVAVSGLDFTIRKTITRTDTFTQTIETGYAVIDWGILGTEIIEVNLAPGQSVNIESTKTLTGIVGNYTITGTKACNFELILDVLATITIDILITDYTTQTSGITLNFTGNIKGKYDDGTEFNFISGTENIRTYIANGTYNLLIYGDLSNLTYADIRNSNIINKIDLSYKQLLTAVLANGNNIDEFNFENCISLNTLNISDNNNNKTINLSGCTSFINIQNLGDFISLNLSNCINVKTLSVTNVTNSLILDISDCVNLETLRHNNSSFDTINLNTNVNILNIYGYQSDITEYDFQGLTKLKYIESWQCNSLASVKNATDAILGDTYFFSGAISTQQEIDDILQSNVNSLANNKTCRLENGTNSAPSTSGEANIDILRSRGWPVTVTGGY